MKKEITRRSFIETSVLAGVGATVLPAFSQSFLNSKDQRSDLEVHIFSKHLQFLDYRDMADAAAQMGFDGIDLSVRNKGHVLPERVKDDLPKAIEHIKAVGFEPKMITSGILSIDEPFTKDILETAVKLGVELYRLGYYKYPKNKSIPEAISDIKKQLKPLSKLNKHYGIKGAYQNHAGLDFGASIWDIHNAFKVLNNGFMGCQYDIRHATVEGGKSWPTGLKLIAPHINSLVLKDFKWALVKGQWELVNVPIGKGMVDFKAYFKLLKTYKIQAPVSLHCEYNLGGAEHGRKDVSLPQKEIFDAMKQDIERIKALWAAVE
ncbi:sugar phosphate isomerase/epimerase family protein [Mariniflexile ostreae]|uniref:Sugar phosphate isomerase/epimerase family protein n=1 Tax=Mariniflexile ostreae TaxID=1520892 RepID=A0ABV5FC58_9FLAO